MKHEDIIKARRKYIRDAVKRIVANTECSFPNAIFNRRLRYKLNKLVKRGSLTYFILKRDGDYELSHPLNYEKERHYTLDYGIKDDLGNIEYTLGFWIDIT